MCCEEALGKRQKEELPICCIAGKMQGHCEDASWWWKERLSQNFSLAISDYKFSEKDLKTQHRKTRKWGCWGCAITRAEKVCFSYVVKNGVEGTWNVTRRSRVTGSVVCCSLMSYACSFQGQIHKSTEKSENTFVTQPQTTLLLI